MAISMEAYIVLESIVGSRYISDDPVICEGYRSGPGGYESGLGYERVMTRIPGCVIMPRTTSEIQKIVKVCCRYHIPYVPYSTGFFGPRSHPHVENALIIDMKRMNDFKIDEKHFYAVVGPGVIYSQLQEESLRRGCYVVISPGGAQTSVIANMIGDGWSPLSYRIGLPQRRILATEIVMPDGEAVRLGSLAFSDDPFWSDGIGPDLRGLLRGATGHRGFLGIVTRMAVKLLPFQPERLVPDGISPYTHLKFPEKRIRWIGIRMPDKESTGKALYEIARAEIGAAAIKVPLFWRAIAGSISKEEFWELWSNESEESASRFNILRILLIGFASEEQMAYEERVLEDIITEFGGQIMQARPVDNALIKDTDASGLWMMCGGYMSVDYAIETLEHAIQQVGNFTSLKKKYIPPLMPDYGESGGFQCYGLGHQGYSEFLIHWDPGENTDEIDQFYVESSKENINKRFYTAFLGPHQPLYLTGPAYGPNYHKWLLAIKNEFDPDYVCHPPAPLAHDQFVEQAEWMRPIKDWESPEINPGNWL